MFFNTWWGLVRIAIVGVLAYLGLIVLLRVSGKRTLSKMNAFDLVITVALGSTLATILLSKDVALVEGLLAFAVLIALQFVITWSSVHSKTVSRLVKSQPALLLYKGRFRERAMRRERVVKAEILAALREQGLVSLENITAVVLETDGSFSVIPEGREADAAALQGLQGRERATETP